MATPVQADTPETECLNKNNTKNHNKKLGA